VLELKQTTQFKKDLKRAYKRGLPLDLLDEVVRSLRAQKALPEKFRDHLLTGNYVGQHECHLQPNWLLIYFVDGENLILTLTRTGTHADLLEK
jgi:mRNA interferase YafQ